MDSSRKISSIVVLSLILGILSLFIFLIFVLPAINNAKEDLPSLKFLSDAKQVYIACRMYADNHGGDFPKNLDELVPTYLEDRHLLSISNGHTEVGYEYFGGKVTDSPKKILFRSKIPTKDHLRAVVYIDGTAETTRD